MCNPTLKDRIGVPVAASPQLTGHISSRTPCTRMRTQR